MPNGSAGHPLFRARNAGLRRLIATAATFLLTTSIVVAVPFSAASSYAADLPTADTGDPEKIVAAALSRFAEQLNELPTLDGLQATLPLSDTSLAQALGLAGRFDDLVSEMDALVAGGDVTEAALEAAIAAAGSGPLTLAADLGDQVGDILPLSIDFSISDTVDIPFSASDGFPVGGGQVTGTASLTGTLAFELDTSKLNAAELDESFSLLTTPTPMFTLSVTAGVPALNIPNAQLGFTAVALTGSASFDLQSTLTINDPDTTPPSNGKITFDEFDATAIVDLMSFAVVDNANDVVNVSLSIDSPVIAGTPDGTFSYQLVDITSTPVITSSLGSLADFQNFSAAEAVGAVERLAVLLGGLQTTGRLDVEIPLIGGSLADVFAADGTLLTALDDLIETAPSTEPGPPPLRPSFATVQGLVDKLDDTLDSVSVSYANQALLFDLTITDSATENVYIGAAPPAPTEGAGGPGSCLDGIDNDGDGQTDSQDPDCAAPIFLRFPDLDILNDIEITAGATASLAGDYTLHLLFGLDLTPEPTEDGAGQGSCSDGVDNDGDGLIDAAEELIDCAGARNLEERVFLDVGAKNATNEATAHASFTATGIDAKARIGILDAGVEDAEVTLGGPATGNRAEILVDLYDDVDGRLTIRDLFNTLGVAGAPSGAGIDTAIAANFSATVPVEAAVDGLTLAGGDISLTSSISGDATAVTDLIDSLQIDASDLATSDLFDFSPCANSVDDDGDGVVNDGCPGTGIPANDDPESESTASLTQIIAAIRAFAQKLDGVGGSLVDQPLPLVGRSLGDLVDFADVVLAVAEDLENPAESDGSLDGGPGCANAVDDDGDGVANDGCPTQGDAPEGGGIAAGASSSQCNDAVDNDGDGKTNDGCPAVNPTLDKVDELISDAIQEALDEAVGALAPSIGVTLGYDAGAKELTFDFNVVAAFERMGSFNVDLGGSLGDLVGLDAAGDVAIQVGAELDLGFGVDLEDLTPFVLDSSRLEITAEASADDIELAASVGPIEFGVGAPGDPASARLGAKYEVALPDVAGDRIEFAALTWPGGTFSGIDQAGCDAGDDGCATIPLYLGDTKLGEIDVDVNDVTVPDIDVTVPPALATEIGNAIAGELLDFALIESGLGRLIEVLTSLIADGLLAVDIPLIGDDLNKIAKFIDGIGNGTDTDGDGTPDTSGLTGIIRALVEGGDPFEVAAAAETAKGNEQEVYVTLNDGVTPTPEVQTITVTGADGGTFDVAFGGSPATVDYDAAAAALQTALEGLAEIGTSNVSVAGAAGAWTVTFTGALRDRDLAELTVDGTNLTGPDTPSVAAATATDGAGGYFTLSKSGGAASDPIPWDATAAEVKAALEASADFTSVDVAGNGTDEDDPWNLSNFNPADPGELDANDAELEGTVTVTLVSAIPTVGDAQDALDDFTADMKQELFDAGLLLDASDPTFETQAAAIGDGEADLTVVCPGCNDSDPATLIEGIRFDILLGQVGDATASVDYDFDLGVPGLDLAAKGTPGVEGKWKIELGLELNKTDGFFIDVGGPTPELLASAEAYLTDPDGPPPSPPSSLEGRIAFVGIDLYDGTVGLESCDTAPQGDPCDPAGDDLPTSLVKAQFEIDITDPGTSANDGKFSFAELTNSPRLDDVFAAKIQAAADVNLHLESFIADTGASLPRIYADLQLYWAWAWGSANDEVTITRDGLPPAGANEFHFTGTECAAFDDCFSIALNNTNMDAGSFVSSFLAPVLSDVQKFTKPLQPVFDTLNKPIPVLSDLGPEPVTLLSLAKALGPANNNYGFIFDLIELITFINNIETSQDRLIIALGSPNDYTLATSRLLSGPVAAEQAKDAFSTALPSGNLIDGGGLDRNVTKSGAPAKSPKDLASIGLSFPFLEEPAKVLGLLFGQDVDLIVWQPKPLSFGFSYSQKFGPIWSVPPVFLEVGGSVSVTGRFGIGYDTQGLREILFEDAGPEALLHGVFLLDRDASGRDVNELELSGELFANAQVSVLIFSAGAGGSVFATIGIDLQDPNSDGKLKFPEIADIVRATGNPFCIFNLNGQFGVRIFVFAEVDLFFWSKRWRKDLAEIILYEFKIECDPNALVEPVLARAIAGNDGSIPGAIKTKYGLDGDSDVLRLNLGAHKGGRDANGTSIGSGIGEEEFTVTQEVDGSLTVQAFGFQQNYAADDGSWELVLADGSGDDADNEDTLILLDGGDEDPTTEDDLNAAATPFTVPAYVVGSAGPDSYILGGGNDTLNAGAGKDTADGRGGNDALNGEAGEDSLNGGPGVDTIDGGSEADYIEGGPGGDTLNGGPGDDEIVGGADEGGDADGIDTIDGGPGMDDIDGGPGGDIIDGGPDRDNIQGGTGNDVINGGEGGNESNCAANGGPGAADPGTAGDTIYGGPGMDTINGEGGDDYLVGGSAIDASLDEKDIIHGNAGCDTIWGDNVEITSTGEVRPQDPEDTNEYGPDELYGDAGNDLIRGQDGNDDIFGGDGDDDMTGDAGNDFMFGDDGTINDRATADVTVTEDGGDGADVIRGSDGVDHQYGGGDVDTMYGDDGDDVQFGNSGNDVMRGGRDHDVMSGNGGADEMYGDSGNDLMYGDADTPGSSDGADDMRGGIGNDYMFGNADGDDMRGDSGDDRMVGGGDDATSTDNTAGDPDVMRGGSGADVMAGDNATISDATVRLVTLRLDGEGAGDDMHGDTEPDRMFGQAGDDEMHGGTHGDYIEGNAGSDDIDGEAGNDDLIGGGSANDGANGVIDADRTGDDLADEADEIWGGDGVDWIAGDNAKFDRNFDLGTTDDLVLFDVNSTDAGVSGGDRIYGGADADVIFGQGNGAQDPEAAPDAPDLADNDLDGETDEDGDLALDATEVWLGDAIFGEGGNDYIEGNHGADLIEGGDGADDLIGGGSSDPEGPGVGVIVLDGGVFDATRNGSGLLDGRDSMHGDDDVDWMTGDNAFIARNVGAASPIVLFDVNSSDTAVSSGDWMSGGDADDVMFGQGNGTQGDQSDPIDGMVDNDLDNDVEGPDEDVPWEGDVMFGDAGNDYMEGNHGADLMYGGADDDDMVGGGSALDLGSDATGTIDGSRTGTGLKDVGDVMFGEGGEDWMAGDNALIERTTELGAAYDLRLFDVNSDDQTVGGGDFMNGGDDPDRMFGQGNGAQPADRDDPLDGVDNDADGTADNLSDQPWLGDVMFGGAADDYMEGNHGADAMWGGGGDDDMIGGGSAFNGIVALNGGAFDESRTGNGLDDRGDVMRGEAGIDFMAGDNARIDRSDDVIPFTGLVLESDRSVVLFDVEIAGDALDVTDFSGGDWMSGGTESDVMFGQGNGDQPADQADPLDGVDNDFDGREDPAADDLGWDCADYGFDNDGDGFADAADGDCTAPTVLDEDQPWLGDLMFGNADDDYMEGNHGADWMFGDDGFLDDSGPDGEDDMIGGGSAFDGAITPTRVGTDLKDGPDVMHGEGEDDVMTGDNAAINRNPDLVGWERLVTDGIPGDFGPYDQAVRVTTMEQSPEADGAFDDDYMTGGIGQDEMYGQLGDDFVRGDEGDDALVGDLGQVTANLMGDGIDDPTLDLLLETNSPRWDALVNQTGSMVWNTVLFSFDTSQGGVGGDDVLLGYDGRDTVFAGPGDDIVNGDGDGTNEFLDAENPEFSHITDIVEGSDADFLFGGDGNDAMWGGRDDDLLYGGYDEDYLDVRPREDWDNGDNGPQYRFIPRDPPGWWTFAYPENLQDVDFMYGGWDRDAMQADQAANGPDPGDRMADWAGGFNVFYVCPAGYGDYTITRSGAPNVRDFLQQYAEASGAYDTATDGTSGFRDVAYVFTNQRGDNSSPPHPDHPGHFECVDLGDVTP